jgi:hypothetical protein
MVDNHGKESYPAGSKASQSAERICTSGADVLTSVFSEKIRR